MENIHKLKYQIERLQSRVALLEANLKYYKKPIKSWAQLEQRKIGS